MTACPTFLRHPMVDKVRISISCNSKFSFYDFLKLKFPVGYRKRKLIKGIRKTPPQSGDTFLQLEIASNPLSGNNMNILFTYCHK